MFQYVIYLFLTLHNAYVPEQAIEKLIDLLVIGKAMAEL